MALIFEPTVSASQFLSAKRRRTSSRQNHRERERVALGRWRERNLQRE